VTRLLRVLGGAFGLAMVVGATVGGGILRTPQSVAAALPTTALFLSAWILGGIISLLGGTIFAELGAMVPRSGGMYVYARRAFGPGIGFFVGYVDWLNWGVSSAALILLIGEYAGGLIPALAGHALAGGSIAFALLVVLQWLGVRSGGRTQEVITLAKSVALIVLVAAVFVLPHTPLPSTTAPPPLIPHGVGLLLAFGVAMQGVIFSYDNYYAIVYCGEEIRDPGRAIPRAIFRGLLIIIAIYLLINAAFLTLVPTARLAGDPFVGATVARMIFGSSGDAIIRAIMVVAIAGTVNAQIMAAPRVLLALANDGLFPHQATTVNAQGTPTVALALSLIVIGAFLLIGSFDAALGVDAFVILINYLIAFAGLFVLRLREPTTERPYRAWGFPAVQLLTIAVVGAIFAAMIAGDRKDAMLTAGVMAVSWPVWLVVRGFLPARATA
jgi:APA family basic amino acid/polyamine antiporter